MVDEFLDALQEEIDYYRSKEHNEAMRIAEKYIRDLKPTCMKNIELEGIIRKNNVDYCCLHSTLSIGCSYMRIKEGLQFCNYYKRLEK